MWFHPEIRTLPDIPRYWSHQKPEGVALHANQLKITYQSLEDRTNLFAQALIRDRQAGQTGRSNVAFIGKNNPEFWVAWFGSCKAGSAFVPLNWRCTAQELAEVIDDSAPSTLIVAGEYSAIINAALELATHAPNAVIVFQSEAEGGTGLNEWYASVAANEPAVHVTGEDIALIAYTSGTTGRPKGAMIRHEAFSFSALSDELEPTIEWLSNDVNLMVMPNFHLAGSWVSLPTLYHGGTVAMIPAFGPEAALEAIERYRPTTLCLVPTAIQALLASARKTNADVSSLRTLIYAGSPMPATAIDQAVTELGCGLRQFYGTTETYIITILRPDDHVVTALDVRASCGAPVPLVSVRIVDADGTDVADEEVGQVLVRSPMVMAGYLGQPDETAQVLQDGWYWTGDLGYRASTGHYFLVDRTKDMVVSGGENVYSVEVERAIGRHPAVEMVAVVGAPDERWGEAVTAYVVPSPDAAVGGEALADELKKHCNQLIAAYKVPKQIHIEETLPMTPTGKVRKVDLREKAINEAANNKARN